MPIDMYRSMNTVIRRVPAQGIPIFIKVLKLSNTKTPITYTPTRHYVYLIIVNLHEITMNEIRRAVKQISPWTAPGEDRIKSTSFHKISQCDSACESIRLLFNKCMI